jgi:hypothetical protein
MRTGIARVYISSSDQIADGVIETLDIADGQVTNVKLAANAVTSAKIADGTIVNVDISPGALIDGTKLDPNTPLTLIAPAKYRAYAAGGTVWSEIWEDNLDLVIDCLQTNLRLQTVAGHTIVRKYNDTLPVEFWVGSMADHFRIIHGGYTQLSSGGKDLVLDAGGANVSLWGNRLTGDNSLLMQTLLLSGDET